VFRHSGKWSDPLSIDELLADLPTIETERLLLRKITLDDAAAIFEYASDPQVSRYMPWEPHQSIAATYEYLAHVVERYQQHLPGPWGIIHKRDAKLIGTCAHGVWNHDHSRSEIGYVLNRSYWGQGYMPEAARAIIGFGFRELRLNRIEARCETANIGSARVMEKAGMTFEGVLRQQVYTKSRYRDMKIYSILRSEWEAQP
jgi:ribosomal-protein-alanine N-acetyltransferase